MLKNVLWNVYSECHKLKFQLASKNYITEPNNWNTNEMAGIAWVKDFLCENHFFFFSKT